MSIECFSVGHFKEGFTQRRRERRGVGSGWHRPLRSQRLCVNLLHSLTNNQGPLMHINEVSGAIIAVSIEIHRQLGPGLLESVYRQVLAHELRKRGFQVQVEEPVPVIWDNFRLEVGYRADLIVNDLVIVEIKSVETIHPVQKKQLLTYLKLADKHLGLLINFNVELLKLGVSRVANHLPE